jgi:GT2 family glycosyltransferase
VPVAVWIEGQNQQAVRHALTTGVRAPVAVLDGPLATALAQTTAQRVLLARGGDTLAPLALERLAQAATLAPQAAAITCDDDVLESSGRRSRPRFRPAPSPDRWLACDDSGCAMLVDRELALATLPLLSGEPGWRHELVLRLAGPDGARAAHVPLLLVHRSAGPEPTPALGVDVVQHVLARFGSGARVELGAGVRRVRRSVVAEPSVEVVICFRDRPDLLRRCVDSLLGGTRYERLHVALVDNGSAEPETLELLGRYEGAPRIRVLSDPRPFNFAALNNRAAATSDADFLVLLNNDTEILDPDWVSTLLEEAARPEVGAVAPLLLYPGGTVQHAGVALGLHDYAGHPFAGLPPDRETPFGRANGGTRNWLAVTAACMMVERSKFLAVGGFDEMFVVAGNDVDLCLRLTAAGYRSLCVPHAVVIHDESKSRGAHIDPGDFVRSEHSYGEFRTVGDPFYNPNLTFRRTDCSVRRPDEGRG